MDDTIDSVLKRIHESNEVPYIIPRIVIGAVAALIIVTNTTESFNPANIDFQLGLLSLIVFTVISWFIGYIIDAISIAWLNYLSPLDGDMTMVYFKSLEGYRYLLISSAGFGALFILLIEMFTYFTLPAIEPNTSFGFGFFLWCFLATVTLVTSILYQTIRFRRFRASMDRILGHDDQSKELRKKQMEISDLQNRIKEIEEKLNSRISKRDIEASLLSALRNAKEDGIIR
ncbi:hypothetical protein [Roseivivax sp. CAU 1753]